MRCATTFMRVKLCVGVCVCRNRPRVQTCDHMHISLMDTSAARRIPIIIPNKLIIFSAVCTIINDRVYDTAEHQRRASVVLMMEHSP